MPVRPVEWKRWKVVVTSKDSRTKTTISGIVSASSGGALRFAEGRVVKRNAIGTSPFRSHERLEYAVQEESIP